MGWIDRDALMIPQSDAENPLELDLYLRDRFKLISHVLEMEEDFATELEKVVYEIVCNNLQVEKGNSDYCIVEVTNAVIRIISKGTIFNQIDKANAVGEKSYHGLNFVYDFMNEHKKRVKFEYIQKGMLNIYEIDLSRLKPVKKCLIKNATNRKTDFSSLNVQEYIMPSQDCDFYLYDVPREEKHSKSRIFIFDVLKDQVFAGTSNKTLILRFQKGDRAKKGFSRIADVDPRVKIAPDRD